VVLRGKQGEHSAIVATNVYDVVIFLQGCFARNVIHYILEGGLHHRVGAGTIKVMGIVYFMRINLAIELTAKLQPLFKYIIPEHSIQRYRHWYAKLLRLYPKSYRERFGEGMEQTFNGLCLERRNAKGGLFGFVLWVFVETSSGIIRENITFIIMQNKRFILSYLQ
jgi:hypothetical protein